MTARHFGDRVKQVSVSVGKKRSSRNAKRHVSTERRSQLAKLEERQRITAKSVESAKNSRRVGAPPRKSRRHGNTLEYLNIGSALLSDPLKEDISGTPREIFSVFCAIIWSFFVCIENLVRVGEMYEKNRAFISGWRV